MKVNLAGPDDNGRWFLHDENGNAFPLVVKDQDHLMAAALFGWIDSEEVIDDRIESARLWLMDCIGDEIDVPAHVEEYFLELRREE